MVRAEVVPERATDVIPGSEIVSVAFLLRSEYVDRLLEGGAQSY
jgi:hypothetical protein